MLGKAKTKEARQTIINPEWNFEKMGIGGLDKEFSDIFRRAFASRVFPPDIVEQMGETLVAGYPELTKTKTADHITHHRASMVKQLLVFMHHRSWTNFQNM